MSDKKNNKLSALFGNKTFVMILSLVLAIVIWSIVVFGISPDTKQTISGVPVNLDLNNASFQSQGLDITDRSVILVDVEVYGPRTVVGALTADDIVVEPNYARVNGVGTYTLVLTAAKANQLDDFQILSVNPQSVSLSFDVSTSKRFTVEADGVGFTAQEGYVIEAPVVSPAEVRITGPENDVARISRVVAHFELSGELNKSETINDCPLILYDADGNEVSQTTLTIDNAAVDIRVPVYKLGTLPLDISFTNVPDGFDVSTLDYVLSTDEIEVAGSESVIDNLGTYTVGYIDLTSFSIGDVYTFTVELPSGLINRGPETITVTFPRENISSKRIAVTNIQVVNVPTNYTVSVVTTRIENVTVIGPAADVTALLPGSVVAIVDFSTLTLESGRYSVPVTFKVTSNATTWVAGSYTVYIDVVPN